MTKNRENHNYIKHGRFVFTQLLYCRNNFGNKFLKSFNLPNLFLLIIEFSWLLIFLKNDMLLNVIKERGLEKWVFYNEAMIYFLLLLQLSEKAVREYWSAVQLQKVHKDLRKLSEQMEQADEFAPQNIRDEIFGFPTASYHYYSLNNMALTTPVQVIR